MITPEILAPAGGEEQLIAAVRTGADAVYLGADGFNARRSAKNFDRESLKKAVDYCHEYGVRVYLTMNTLVRDSEIDSAMSLFEYACGIPVDAIIVQDIGLARLMRKSAPDMRLHASTQMSLHSPGGIKTALEMGFKRVVLAREVSEKRIKEMAKEGTELECFVHGALCMSVSGQCYLSAMLGSRSGNRGGCAQPCRLPFSCEGKDGYALSLKDLSLLDSVGRLAEDGVCSLKIEGRMKRPEYVAAAVSSCRYARDTGRVPEQLEKMLSSVFSRSGFTSGYFDGMDRVNAGDMFGFRRYEDVSAATNEIMKELRSLYAKEMSRIGVDFEFTARRNQQVSLTATDGANTGRAVGDIPQTAVNRAIDSEFVEKQLSKTGGTPYYVKNINSNIDDGLALGASSVNVLRREALENLTEKRKKESVHYHRFRDEACSHSTSSVPSIRGIFRSCDIPEQAHELEMIYVPSWSGRDELLSLKDRGFNTAVEAPRGLFDGEDKFRRQLENACNAGIDCVMVQNLGEIPIAREFGMRIHSGFGLNIMNTASLITASELGVEECELSMEAALKDAGSMGAAVKRGIIIYGYLPLMLTRNCPVACSGAVKCAQCGGKSSLTDRKGKKFRVVCANGYSELLNTVPLCMFDRFNDIKGVDFTTLRFNVENSVEIGDIINMALERRNPFEEYTRGLFYRGIE